MTPINPNEVHPIQGRILRELLFHPERRFSELTPQGVSSDQLSFHVKRLSDLNLISKIGETYTLTAEGKEFANRFDADTTHLKVERQAKIGTLTVCTRGEGGSKQYLIQQRLKQPYYGFYGFVGGKMRWGEQLLDAAARELKEETGLNAKIALVGIEHKMDYDNTTRDLLEDKFFFFFHGEHAEGQLLEQFEGGRNAWLMKSEILKLPNLFHDVLEGLELIDGKEFRLIERKYDVEKY